MSEKKKSKPSLLREGSFTYDDYAAYDDGQRYELVDGKMELMSPGPSVSHQLISSELQDIIKQSCGKWYIVLDAPIDLILSDTEVRQPDLVLVSRGRMDILAQRGIIGIPDLVVEILSPSTRKRDKLDKLKSYAKHHIPEYWILDPATYVIEQYLLEQESSQRYELVNLYQDRDLIQSPRLPCVSFTMEELYQRTPQLDS